jgi:hypothetical protein
MATERAFFTKLCLSFDRLAARNTGYEQTVIDDNVIVLPLASSSICSFTDGALVLAPACDVCIVAASKITKNCHKNFR